MCPIRSAVPSDSTALGELIYIAAPGNCRTSGYDLSIGGSRERQVQVLGQLAGTPAPSWFHHTHFLVAECDGQVVAAVAGFDRITSDVYIPAAMAEIGWKDFEIELLNARLEPVYRCFPPEKPGTWTIDHVAALPTYRRMGLVRRLIIQQLNRGREAGYEIAQLDVFYNNLPAIALYESLRFSHSVLFGDEVFQQLLQRGSLLRMIRRL